MLKMIIFLLLLTIASSPLFSAERSLNEIFEKANEYTINERYELAAEEYEEILRRDDSLTRAHLLLGLIYSRLNRRQEAIEHTLKVTQLEPTSYSAFYNLGLIYASDNQPDNAIAALDEALKLNPTSYAAEYQKGIIYSFEGNHEEAKKAFQRSIDLNPDFEEAHIGLTGSAYKSGNKEEALTYIEDLKAQQKKELAAALEQWVKKQDKPVN